MFSLASDKMMDRHKVMSIAHILYHVITILYHVITILYHVITILYHVITILYHVTTILYHVIHYFRLVFVHSSSPECLVNKCTTNLFVLIPFLTHQQIIFIF
jgi:hypothetical protein